MDKYSDRVPVRTFGSGTRYDGKVWYEMLSSICSINGKPTSNVEKSMLTAGDKVTVMFKNKPYPGVVDPTADDEVPALDSRDVHALGLGERQPRQELGKPTGVLGGQEPTQDRQPRQETPIAGQEPTQGIQSCQEKPILSEEPPMQPQDKTPSRTSPRKPKPKKRPRDTGASPPRASGKKKRLVPKKGEIVFSLYSALRQ